MKDSTGRPRRHGVVALLKAVQITGLNTDLMRLLKTSVNKMVMYIIASSLDGIFRRIGKSIL